MSTKEEKIELEGEVTESLRNGMFRIALDNGHSTIGYTAGKMRRYRIRTLPGDRGQVERSPHDLTRGRVVYRLRYIGSAPAGHSPGRSGCRIVELAGASAARCYLGAFELLEGVAP